MNISMQELERLNLVGMRELLEGSRAIRFSVSGREEVYELVSRVLKAQQYRKLSKGQRGIVRRFLSKVTGMSRAQMTRLIQQWMSKRRIEPQPPRRPSFARRYRREDIALLARVDAAHED